MSLSDKSLRGPAQSRASRDGAHVPQSGAGGPESSVEPDPAAHSAGGGHGTHFPSWGPASPPRTPRLLRELLTAGCEGSPWALRRTSTRVEGHAWSAQRLRGSRWGPRLQAHRTPPRAASVQPNCTPAAVQIKNQDTVSVQVLGSGPLSPCPPQPCQPRRREQSQLRGRDRCQHPLNSAHIRGGPVWS